jgi:hypothetical protein
MKSFPAKKTKEFMGTDYEMLAKTLIGIKGKKFLSIDRLLVEATRSRSREQWNCIGVALFGPYPRSQSRRPNQASLCFLVNAPVQDSELKIFKAICPSHFLAPPVINAQYQIEFAEKSVLSSLSNGEPSRPHEINAGAYQAWRANLEIAGGICIGKRRNAHIKPQAPSRAHGFQWVGLIGTILLRRTSDQPTPLRRQGNANA